MFPFAGQENVRPLASDDEYLLSQLVQNYGLMSIKIALAGLEESSRASMISTISNSNTLVSTGSAPSLSWTASDVTSIRTGESTRNGDVDVHSIHASTPENTSWLASPCEMRSPIAVPLNVRAQTTSYPPSPKQMIPTLKKYQCPMCFLDHNLVEFGRKSDFKKHLNNFHSLDVTWICRTKNCSLSFATERAYSTHSKDAHKMEALPSSAARTELCPQLVFACGFSKCKDRIFEASSPTDTGSSRDKYFEHIAKHFEDEYNVNDWEYAVQIHNLMRQSRVKSVWKTCIWPKEKRTQLSWKPRSSGDLKRMLECRHLGDDISTLVRLAYILGTAPFTSSRTPPPAEIDQRFKLPIRSQCLLEKDRPAANKVNSNGNGNSDESSAAESRPQSSIFRFPSRKGRTQRPTRPSTPVSMILGPTPAVCGDRVRGPHPGTPIPLPSEKRLPADAPKFAPEAPPMPRQVCADEVQQLPQQQQPMYALPNQEDSRYGFVPSNGMPASPYDEPMVTEGQYPDEEIIYGCTPQSTITVRPATPVPNKRPASWSRHHSMEELHPKKRITPEAVPFDNSYGTELLTSYTHDYVPNAYGEYIPQCASPPLVVHAPTSMPPGWSLPMRMSHEVQGGFEHHPPQHHHHQHHHPDDHSQHFQQYSPAPQDMTFFFDDTEARV